MEFRIQKNHSILLVSGSHNHIPITVGMASAICCFLRNRAWCYPFSSCKKTEIRKFPYISKFIATVSKLKFWHSSFLFIFNQKGGASVMFCGTTENGNFL